MENDADRKISSSASLYRMLPSVNDLLLTDELKGLVEANSHSSVAHATRRALEIVRQEVAEGRHTRESLNQSVAQLPTTIAAELGKEFPYSLRPVINATGVLLHTNLGRAPLSRRALEHVARIAQGYCNLELDLESGERGSRDAHVEESILALLERESGIAGFAGTHRAIVVNNCAAATLLALSALAKGQEVIVSRGELVEIGGGFRIPEILDQSGAFIREVGTTNRTRIADYERAITPNSGLLLRVHPSNFSMEGFVARPSLGELVDLGKTARIPVFEDQGTGLVHALEGCGIEGEATLMDSLRQGCDLVAASGDKLLGGPQCGILVGRKPLVEMIRKNPLFRALRVDKLIYAALEATLADYLSESLESIPLLRMLHFAPQEIEQRCEGIAAAMTESEWLVEVVPVESLIGGGSAPKARLQSFAISLQHPDFAAEALLRRLRQAETPIIGRISDDRVLLDLRTVSSEQDIILIGALRDLLRLESPAVDVGSDTRA
jgi:L-seryl-tRNA(Ser) seleniumtransferase